MAAVGGDREGFCKSLFIILFFITHLTRCCQAPFSGGLDSVPVAGRALSGPRAGLKTVRLCGVEGHVSEEDEPDTPRCCAEADGFGLHAGTALPAYDREGVEHLLRYMCRPPVALDRLEALPDGRLLFHLKKRWRDGTDSVVFEPLEFLERLAALVPAPRFNMIRYSGVLAPAASWRDRLAPCVESMEDEPEAENAAECPDTAPDLANLPDRPTDVGIGPVSPAPVLAHPQTSADPCPAQTSSGAAGGAGCPQPARGDTEDTRLPGDADPRPADGPRADRMG